MLYNNHNSYQIPNPTVQILKGYYSSQKEVLRFETAEEHRDGHMGLVKVALQGETPNGMGEGQMAQSLAESSNLEWHSHSLWKPLSQSVSAQMQPVQLPLMDV